MKIRYTLTKKDILTHKKNIQKLFNQGTLCKLSLINFYYLPASTNHHEVLFSVPKRLVKKAIYRNTIKRLMREAYRLKKHSITISQPNVYFLLAYVYQEKKTIIPAYRSILSDIKLSILHLQNYLSSIPKA